MRFHPNVIVSHPCFQVGSDAVPSPVMRVSAARSSDPTHNSVWPALVDRRREAIAHTEKLRNARGAIGRSIISIVCAAEDATRRDITRRARSSTSAIDSIVPFGEIASCAAPVMPVRMLCATWIGAPVAARLAASNATEWTVPLRTNSRCPLGTSSREHGGLRDLLLDVVVIARVLGLRRRE